MPVRTTIAVSLIAISLAACSSVSSPSREGGSLAASGVSGRAGKTSSAANFVPVSGLPVPSFGTASSGLQYRLGPLDTVNVLVFQAPELSGDFQVGSDGMLAFPLIGGVRAAGRTSQDVQQDITSRLQASYMQSPQVTVKVTGFNSQKVTVDGSVLKPGVFPVSGTATLLNYIAMAGGMPRTADPANVVVFRDISGKRMAARFDVDAIRDGKTADPIVYGGDTIVVPASGLRSAWSDFLSAMPAANVVATVSGL